MGLFSLFKKSAHTPQSTPPPPDRSALNADLVVPMISGQAWMDANQEIFSKIPDFPADEWPVDIPYAEDIFITYAIDPGPSWEVVSIGTADRFGTRDQLHAVALENLRRRGDVSIEGAEGRFRLTLPEEPDLSASVLLQPDRWRKAIPIADDLVIAIPTRIEVLICAVNDKAAISTLAEIARKRFDAGEGKPISPNLYRLRGTSLSSSLS